MPATSEAPLTGVFDQAVQSFGDALKAGVKTQEQIAGFWSDALSKSSATDYQKKARGLFTDGFPVLQKANEDYLRVLESSFRKSVEAVKKAYDGGTTTSPTEVQSKAQGLMDAAVELLKENTQALTQTNLRVLDGLADLVRQGNATVAAATVKPPVK